MIRQLFAKAGIKKARVGIEVQSQGLAIAVRAELPQSAAPPEPDNSQEAQSTAGDSVSKAWRPSISHSSLLLNEAAGADQISMLNDWVESQGLVNSSCYMVLANNDYQLLLVEAPDVPEDELREAVRWRIKELISIPVDKAAIDVFMLPEDGSRGGKKMAYVVVTELTKIHSMIELVRQSGLKLVAIDIVELALRNIAYMKEMGNTDSLGVAIVRLVSGGGTVSLYRKGNLYLSRQFQLSFGGGLLDDIPADSFILEVQRSLDYYERQMGQSPPSVLYICGENISEDKITLDISRGLNVPAKYLNLEESVLAEASIDEGMLHVCVAALGGVLRDDVVNNHRSVEA